MFSSLRLASLAMPTRSAALKCASKLNTFRSASTASEAVADLVDSDNRKPLFNKILIANRGEIACRIMRTAKKLGVKTVAVFSEADRDTMHVQMADESYCIGPAASAESYLKMEKIIGVAKQSGAQAIHPGYGFLSENASFAEAVTNAGLVFIGPPKQAIIDMGSKSESKKIMEAAGVPCVPGYHGEGQEIELLKTEAQRIGYPVLIKAIKGGGGKGMRIVEKPEDFELMLESAKREAIKSFGDDKVLIEKYLTRPRHVEVQVFADTHGNAVYLFERDCSVQRRHQKVLEEAPAPGLTPELRASLGAKAVAAAKAVNYVGAGTVEFILDTTDNKFYFMEMNTRLQVEHPVTEMVTNTDLVEWQLEVAAGNLLPKMQEALKLTGHAFEARIYAENPAKGFLPDTGKLVYMSTPETSDRVRVETGVRQGDEVSVYYDPMISKLVVRGKDRDEALRRLCSALEEFHVAGLHTNISFLTALATHPSFIAGDVETGFIPKFEKELLPPPEQTRVSHRTIAQIALGLLNTERVTVTTKSGAPYDPWNFLPGLRLNHTAMRTYNLKDGDKDVSATVTYERDGTYTMTTTSADGSSHTFTQSRAIPDTGNPYRSTIELGGERQTVTLVRTPHNNQVHLFAQRIHASLVLPPPVALISDASLGGANSVKTPMPCKISQVHVKKGDKVEKGTPVAVLEAMKMEHVVRAPMSGIVEKVWCTAGQLMAEGKVLVSFVAEGAPAEDAKK
ncbi:carbamoyl-phosphate synthase L chain, ATP binding domain-containing protein [Phlyctochytrium arcticum]|nr:carbamoyl-phosphate synthase L chain, ATP binding domain-containing protein [Phlyctochytrium arcticum]